MNDPEEFEHFKNIVASFFNYTVKMIFPLQKIN